MDSMPLLRFVDVWKEYRTTPGSDPLQILRGANLAIQPGERLAIVGPSGSGKSTVLNLLGALDRPDRGQVLFEGSDLGTFNDQGLSHFRNSQIGFIFQSHHLLPHCSALENTLVPLLAENSEASKAATDRARNLLARVGLKDRMSHHPSQLSGGERQRVAVVRALINHPKVLLADEPTGALDQKAASELAELLLQINAEEKVGLIVVTHSTQLAARMGRQVELHQGQLSEGLVSSHRP